MRLAQTKKPRNASTAAQLQLQRSDLSSEFVFFYIFVVLFRFEINEKRQRNEIQLKK